MKKYATTFGGSEFTVDDPVYQDGIKLGKYLASKGYTVKNGGYYGLMEAVSKGVVESGGQCIGITNASFDPKPANQFITEEIKAKDLFDRLRLLIQSSELFVIQNGSIGTVDELCVTWCLRYTLTMPSIRICLIGGFWSQVLYGLQNLAIKKEEFDILEVYKDIEDFSDCFRC
ncbi:hypothetical protein MC7420_6703 [Coleofasciculus chthonoplastes PCC 7420]|uniref:Uncharacterized protein n=1 Tax=Coleofasciculus chthonoplastes PCC 7420 TaxID=118168 RepID=B4VWC6_9CYAN|nr:LOG family protein [Coleofasciculus chthonoplastes]EDX73655.1 hypothetical protein MC7420_6703 [Coleofasciculus chthonoplastes PCC 7420]